MQQLARQSRIALREGMSNYFNNEDLEILCFDLGVIYENLPSKTRNGKIKDLILYLERIDNIELLIERCSSIRPNVAWKSWIHYKPKERLQTNTINDDPFTGHTGSIQVVYGSVTNVTVNVTYLGQNLGKELQEIAKFAKPVLANVIAPSIFEAPPFSTQLIGRSDEITLIRNTLTNPPNDEKITVISGMGGIGKTTLAIAVANDPKIQQAFPDGILWANFRDEADLHKKLMHWLSILLPTSDNNTFYSSSGLELLPIFRSLIIRRRFLIVLDGLDESEDVQTSQAILNDISSVVGNHSQVLVTSRIIEVQGAGEIFSLDLLPEKDALQLLTKQSTISKEEQQLAREIVQLCGYHPLAIRIAAHQIDSGHFDLRSLRNGLAHELGEIQNVSIDNLRKSSVMAALEYAVESFKPEVRSKFYQLSVFGEDEYDLRAVSTVWRVSEPEAKLIISQFLHLALLNHEDNFYKMHPLVLKYVKTLFDKTDWDDRAETLLAYSQYVRSQK